MRASSRLEWGRSFAVLLLGLVCFSITGLALTAPQEDKAKSTPQADAKPEKKEEGLPLKPTRKISFTTDEGTWMSLDVSPDGKQIVNSSLRAGI
jgi:hypothetical protein